MVKNMPNGGLNYNFNDGGLATQSSGFTGFQGFKPDQSLVDFNNTNNSLITNPAVPPAAPTSFLDKLKGSASTFSDVASGLSGLAGSYAGYKQLGLAEDAFKFNKAMKEKEYAMAKDAYDRNVARSQSIGNQMRAGGVS